jgi:hypothetical protein
MRRSVLVLVAALAAVGCSDDDAGGESTPATTTPTTSSVPPSTSDVGSTTASSSSPPTTDPPTTTDVPTTTDAPIDEEALKAEIAEDYERAFYRRASMLADPSLRNLESRVATVLVEDSPAFETFVARVRELVALGDVVIPNDPNLYSATVESVRLVGEPPYRRAIVTVCEVDNRRQVTPPENSPTGNEIEVAGTGKLLVTRIKEPVRRTDLGWLRYRTKRNGIGFVQGETTCPPA